jgi:transposase
VNDEEWAFVAPYLALCREDAAQREHPLRAVFNGLRYIVKTGNQWRMMPHDLPPWPVVYRIHPSKYTVDWGRCERVRYFALLAA